MIYPNDYESRLGFGRIREMIQNSCSTQLAKNLAEQQRFSTSFKYVKESLLQTSQMVESLTMYDDFPSSGYVDTEHFLYKIGVEGMFIEAEELLSLMRSMDLSEQLRRFFVDKDTLNELRRIGENIGSFVGEIRQINLIIDEFAKVKDTASPELGRIRGEIVSKEREVGRKLQSILSKAQSEGVVEEDATLSVRDGRLVIPVASQFKRRIKGFVHDESATGKTSYIEPVEIVELNNSIKELISEERREVCRILRQFTLSLLPRAKELKSLSHYLSFIDFIKAKAQFAIKIGGVMPQLSRDRVIELRSARHPLLEMTLKKEGKAIVPLDMTLNEKEHILVISGPNAGGKSVCLKSVGLLQYMVQCGVLPSVSENSIFPIFDNIFIDIGDQQSIDNDLSTYSSHLNNMKTVLRYAEDSRSLVLIDEFGTGTEPTIGGAIAESILENLESRGVFALITTHYTNLKYYADNSSGVVSGAMTFDVKNILPLFKLEIGRPGSSFAIEIAHKIGLPEQVLASAKAKIGDEQITLEKQLREAARDKRYWENKRNKIRVSEKRADDLADTYAKELEELKLRKNEMIKEAKREAAQILDGANKLIENTIFEIRKTQADKEKTKALRKKVEDYKTGEVVSEDNTLIDRKMQQLREREKRRKDRKALREEMADVVSQIVKTEVKVRELSVGEDVRIKGQSVIGKIVAISGKKADVHFGAISTMIELSKLERVSSQVAKSAKQEQKNNAPSFNKGVDTHQKRLNFSQQIDLRGCRVDEAMMRAQDFVDEAYMLGFKEVKILHGKGTGALKEEIRKILKTLPFVVSAKDEHEQFGGAGITVVKIE